MSMRIGISLGDPSGIGPEVAVKAVSACLKREADLRFVLIGDLVHAWKTASRFAPRLTLSSKPSDPVSLINPLPESLPDILEPGCGPAAHAAYVALDHAGRMCLNGELDAMVTAPVSKEAIIRAGYDFVGHTEHLTRLAGVNDTVMMLLGPHDKGHWLRVALATTHVPIKDVSARLTREAVELAIRRAAGACADLGLPRQRVAVCGLNPHAGEGGKMGDEEITTIGPAVRSAQESGLDVVGPLSADALFYYAYQGEYDAVVAMYHDQGLGPLKMVCFENGVNWTLGLPFIRTSPDHGTAYNIAGQGKASPSSMIAAIELAVQLARAKRIKVQTPIDFPEQAAGG